MKRFGFILLGISVVVCMVLMYLHSYSYMWMYVENLAEEGYPKLAITKIEKIYEKAKNDKNMPQMLKAYLNRMAFRGEISSDSVQVDIKGLEKWAIDSTTSVYDRAVLYSIMGGVVLLNDFDKGTEFLSLSLKDSALLADYPASKLGVMVKSGHTNEQYMNDNLYEMLVRHAIKCYQDNLWSDTNCCVQCKINELYRSLLKHYENSGNRAAWLLTCLDAYPQADTAFWENLIKEYGEEEVCAEVYLRLSQECLRDERNVECVNLLNKAIKQYPFYNRINVLKEMLNGLVAPELDVKASFVYPDKPISLSLNYRNLNNLVVDVYKVNMPIDGVGFSDLNEKTLHKYTTFLRQENIKINPTPDYHSVDTIITLNALPNGIYYLQMEAHGKKKGIGNMVLYVSSLQMIARSSSSSRREIVVVDKENGHPVTDAVVFVYAKANGHYTFIDVLNENEYNLFDNNKYDSKLYYQARTNDDKSMLPAQLDFGYFFDFEPNHKEKVNINLFTDRSIYRPGQKVHFSGIAYRQLGDSVEVLKQTPFEVKLKYSREKEVEATKVYTNMYGSFSGFFDIPKNEVGIYTISVGDETKWIRVEEYKRPTFEVTFDELDETYRVGDSIMVKGKAYTFAGAPVREAIVRYKVTGVNYDRRNYRGSETVLAAGEVKTDIKGYFSIPVHFQLLGAIKDFVYGCNEITVDVVNGAGEMQSGRLNLPFAKSSVLLEMEHWKHNIVKERISPIKPIVVNLNNKCVAIDVHTWVLSEKGDTCLNWVMPSNETFMPKGLCNLPSGFYQLVVKAGEDNGNSDMRVYPFVLYSERSSRMPYKTSLWEFQTSEMFTENIPATIYWGSSEDSVHLFYDVYSGNRKIESRQIVFSDSLLVFQFPYKKVYGDGISVSLAFMKKNKLYNKVFTIEKPQPDKRLNVCWKTFRDKLQPGARETWTLNVSRLDGKPVNANFMATLYDASLDVLSEHNWRIELEFLRRIPYVNWFYSPEIYTRRLYFPHEKLKYKRLLYSKLYIPFIAHDNGRGGLDIYRANPNSEIMLSNDIVDHIYFEEEIIPLAEQYDGTKRNTSTSVPLRTNFAETAFFYPNLRTDANGEVKIEFTLPESLTTWRFMGLAHTKDMDYGQIASEVVASKEFMIQPNMPRFVRVGDEVSLSASLINQSEKDVIGNVRMELFNPATDKVYLEKRQRFLITPNATTTVHFGFEVSEEYTDLAVRWIAEGDTFSDGEQRVLPVLSNKQQITESVPLYINGEGTSTFSLESLFNHHSKSISHPKMIVEFTGNPGWYAVQALPLLQNPDNENAISWAVAYYANTLSGYLAKTNAEITSRFDADTLSARTSMAIRQLQELQDAEGAWSWYKGMSGSRYVTTQVMELLTRLQQLTGQPLVEKESNGMYEKALAYLTRKAKEEYTRMKKWEKEGMKNLCPSEQVLHYLYICALNGNQKADKEVNRYFIDKLVQLDKIGMLTIYGKSCASIILQDAGYEAKAKAYLQSVMEYSVYTDEMGRYFDTPRAEYSWYSYKIPTQVAVIEAIHRIANEEKTIEELKRWLLQQKRTQDWDTPIATADAVYALLNVGENVLTNTGECQIVLGKEKIRVTKNDTLAYVHQEIKGDVLDIRKVTVKKESKGIGWGAIYAEYWEDMDKIGVQGNALNIRKDVYKDGKPLGDTDVLKVGDKLTIHLTIKADRDMDFIEVKDERAACMEPVDVLSGYRWKDGLGYFQRTKDSSTSFYMDQLRKGTYTLSYEVYVNMAGTYQEGAATIQSVYAPEFSGYVGGNRICVE